MKKYWKSISILIVSVLAVGIFYIQAAFATNYLPQVTIKKQLGDEEILDSIIFSGELTNGERLWLDEEGVKYHSELSFLEQINEPHELLEVRNFRKSYWHFTRGKEGHPNHYFENDDYVAYAAIEYDHSGQVDYTFEFNISVLDKEKNKTTSFALNVPNGEQFLFINLGSVHMVGDELKVITHHQNDHDETKEYHVYTFDVAGKKLIKGEELFNTQHEKNSRMFLLKDDSIVKESDVILFHKFTQAEEAGELANMQLLTYDLEAALMETIDLPEVLSESDSFPLHDGLIVYFTAINDGTLTVIPYDMKQEQIGESLVFEDLSSDERPMLIKIKDEKLYMVSPVINHAQSGAIVVANLASKEIVYQGEMLYKSQSETDFDIRLFDIEYQ